MALLCAQGLAVANGVTAPPGPRLSYIQFNSKTIELRSAGPSGEGSIRIAGGNRSATPVPSPYSVASQLSWSADGGTLAFVAFRDPIDKETKPESAEVFLAFADGQAPRRIPGTVGALSPVLAPDGRSLAFTKVRGRNGGETVSNGSRTRTRRTFARTSIWIAATDGGSARRLTPWRKRTHEWPSSFSPDGSKLGITQSTPGAASRALVLDLAGGGMTTIARGAGYPVYSPDGSKIALVRQVEYTYRGHTKAGKAIAGVGVTTDLFVVGADGANPSRLTRTRAVDLSPSWDPSGRRLAYISLGTGDSELEAFFGFNDSLMEVNADGSCPTKVLSAPGSAYLGPAWQPGIGREAGAISC
jgi:Tol biopolymer transport system component